MKAVCKYPLTDPKSNILLPAGSTILCTQEQFNKIVVYALVNLVDSRFVDSYTFEYFETGEHLPAGYDGTYIGTVMLFKGAEVYHVFYQVTQIIK